MTKLLIEKGSIAWSRRGDTFTPMVMADVEPTLPPALYTFWADAFGRWGFTRIGDRFEFSYKLYGVADHIIDRVVRAWDYHDQSIGVLLNGLKGTGKTVTVQLIANRLIAKGIPVILVGNPIPGLGDVLANLQCPVLLIFDEYEKTHRIREISDDNPQDNLLTVLDGMGRSLHRRMFLFTTNKRDINENLIDRPGRIRYTWEFDRLASSTVEEIVDDLLAPPVQKYRAEIIQYLLTRKALSIDVVKAVLTEANIFGEGPGDFMKFLNLSENTPTSFRLEVVDKNGKAIKVLDEYFRPGTSDSRAELIGYCTKAGQDNFVSSHGEDGWHIHSDSWSKCELDVMMPTEDPNIWLCHVKVAKEDTWVGQFPNLSRQYCYGKLWVDPKPEGWEVPEWAFVFEKSAQGEGRADVQMTMALQKWRNNGSVYGGEDREMIRVRITPNFEGYRVTKMSGGFLDV